MATIYRSAPAAPRFMCAVCYEQLSATPQQCPRCDAPMRELSDEDIQRELRARATAKKKRINGRRTLIVGSAGLAIPFIINSILLWKHVYGFKDGDTPSEASAKLYFFFFLIPFVCSVPTIALLEFVVKRLHVLETTATIEADKASTPELLIFLGLGE